MITDPSSIMMKMNIENVDPVARWKCKNCNLIFFIADCGLTYGESKCPNCKIEIGNEKNKDTHNPN